jgi:hypothetical protein
MSNARMITSCFMLVAIGATVSADAQPLGRDTQTSSSCQIGNIKKGASGKQCEVPIPPSCKVAIHTATQAHWADIEKSGGISCRFDNKLTDWKTRIIGACGACQARQCSAKFTVYFDCPHPDSKPKTP